MNEKDVEEEIQKTFKGLAKREEKNTTSFENWPRIQWTPYELKPRRRDSGSEGVMTKSIMGIAISIAIGIGIGIGIGLSR